MTSRRRMRPSDWLSTAALLAVGLYLGLALHNLLKLERLWFWGAALGAPLVFWGLIGLDGHIGRLVDRFFPRGVRAARSPVTRERPPLAVVCGAPVGVILGLVAGWFGLGGLLVLRTTRDADADRGAWAQTPPPSCCPRA